jgi:antitoxin (DNA-binding transcriptional repressor) of toxin-antitoxin stability system
MKRPTEVSTTEAADRLDELVQRAEQGEEIVLTIDGRAAVRLEPAKEPPARETKRVLLEELRGGASIATPGPSAARSQDFLYDEDGLPLGSRPGKRPLDRSMR